MSVGYGESQLRWWWKLTDTGIRSPSLHQLNHDLSYLGDSLAVKIAVLMLRCASLSFSCPICVSSQYFY